MKYFIYVILLAMGFQSANALAADIYVRKGATGMGTSWTDAYGELNKVSWTGLSGYTLWIAGGSYVTGLPDINIPNTTIKRATVASHGTATGWSDSYDGQVTVT